MAAMGACLISVSAALAARPVQERIDWLQDRVAEHQYICKHGKRKLVSTNKHCQALAWAKRELREAKAEQKQHWYRLPQTGDWQTAVRIVQRVFPGTDQWLLSCSDAESSHGAWVRYGGGPYYAGYEHTDAVGGWVQFRPSTFRGYYSQALAYARQHGFIVPLNSNEWLHGWLSPLGQALTAAYMRAVKHNTGWHWKASVGRGC